MPAKYPVNETQCNCGGKDWQPWLILPDSAHLFADKADGALYLRSEPCSNCGHGGTVLQCCNCNKRWQWLAAGKYRHAS